MLKKKYRETARSRDAASNLSKVHRDKREQRFILQ